MDKNIACADYTYDTCKEGICSSFNTCNGCLNSEDCIWCDNSDKCLLSTSTGECSEKFLYGKSLNGREKCPLKNVFDRPGNDNYIEPNNQHKIDREQISNLLSELSELVEKSLNIEEDMSILLVSMQDILSDYVKI